MTNYMIMDGDGNEITCGVQEHEIDAMAQRIATERGESVWYSDESDPDDQGKEVAPARQA